jgi:predicted peptidase
VFGDGWKVSAVALECDAVISHAALTPSAFAAEGKTITRVYANRAAPKSAQGTVGRYVIIALSTAQRASAALPVSLAQVGPVTAAAGARYPPDPAAITSPETGRILRYNPFVPQNYDRKGSYPMVLFIHGASAVGEDPLRTLRQGVAATIWAAPSG